MHLIPAILVAATPWPDACVAMTLIVVVGAVCIVFVRSIP